MSSVKIQPAKRIQKIAEYYFSSKLQEVRKMNETGEEVVNLGIGNPDGIPDPAVINELNIASREPGNHGYQPYTGVPAFREAIANWYLRYYGVKLDPADQVLPLIGSKEGIMHISMAFLDHGDAVLVPNPGYPAYASVSELLGARIISYELQEERNWQPDLNKLEESGLDGVKLMWVNYPNMPTGQAADQDFFAELIAFATKNNILLVNDNPYSFILNDSPVSLMATPGAFECALELNSLSKSHNMAGWRMGMLVGKAELVQYVFRVKSNQDSGQFKPMQLAAIKALELSDDWYAEVNAKYRSRRELIWKLFDTIGCNYSKTQNGMFVWASIPETSESAVVFAENLLQKARVFITPGFIFGSKGERYVRASLCQPEELIREAIERIKDRIIK
ncbi:MAG: aminotransferase class I/II-fold pyridoxal phosphate-dependent enzyme [Bacteroidales bacterium]|nr:aminotransferase class I/II-fold pyridoxal phosphate-dependent enzyme [Bacteroidales bacterium]